MANDHAITCGRKEGQGEKHFIRERTGGVVV